MYSFKLTFSFVQNNLGYLCAHCLQAEASLYKRGHSKLHSFIICRIYIDLVFFLLCLSTLACQLLMEVEVTIFLSTLACQVLREVKVTTFASRGLRGHDSCYRRSRIIGGLICIGRGGFSQEEEGLQQSEGLQSSRRGRQHAPQIGEYPKLISQ